MCKLRLPLFEMQWNYCAPPLRTSANDIRAEPTVRNAASNVLRGI